MAIAIAQRGSGHEKGFNSQATEGGGGRSPRCTSGVGRAPSSGAPGHAARDRDSKAAMGTGTFSTSHSTHTPAPGHVVPHTGQLLDWRARAQPCQAIDSSLTVCCQWWSSRCRLWRRCPACAGPHAAGWRRLQTLPCQAAPVGWEGQGQGRGGREGRLAWAGWVAALTQRHPVQSAKPQLDDANAC